VTALALADALERHVAAYGANSSNLLAYAPGGGVETVSLAHALNEMLVQSDGQYVQLFPAWPKTEEASFDKLRVKGAFVVSAVWDVATQRPTSVRILSDSDAEGCGLLVPAKTEVRVSCAKGEVAKEETAGGGAQQHVLRADADGRVRWRVRRGVACKVAVGVATVA